MVQITKKFMSIIIAMAMVLTMMPNVVYSSEPRQAQSVEAVIQATMAQLAATVTEPRFGTSAGEWTVLCLARGGYYEKDSAYFAGYYERIVSKVNDLATKYSDAKYDTEKYEVIGGALHNKKSTENSRLIVALSAIGKDATNVGGWDLIAPYDDFGWIKNQGPNGTMWALIALDSGNYQTKDSTIRQQCIDELLSLELSTGGWPLAGGKFDCDITSMALQALYPYRDQPAVKAAVERTFAYLSEIQLESGGFLYGNAETSESSAQVIVACTTWGINPDTDPRFIKNGNSVVDNLLSYYIESEAMFAHQGTISNPMATDQACYALIAYDRLLKGKTALYDFSDVNAAVTIDMSASLILPSKINAGDSFSGFVNISQWDNNGGYKLIDLIVNVPEGVRVRDVQMGEGLKGGQVTYHLEAESGKLRIVCFDANQNSDLTVSECALFAIDFDTAGILAGSKLHFSIGGMSVKRSSDPTDESSMIVVNTDSAYASVELVSDIAYSAVCLYEGDGVDLIPTDKKAVAVSVTSVAGGGCLKYNDGTNQIELKFSPEISAKSGVATYVALVDAAIKTENFVNKDYLTIVAGDETIRFGDANGDGVVNAQDALSVVDAWLRKGEEPTDDELLAMNVNGDSRVNTFDALGIVEAFVGKSEYLVVSKATGN